MCGERRSGQQKERTTGGADSRSGRQLGVWREVGQRTAGGARGEDSEEDSEEDIGRRGQPQWWILNRAVLHLKGNFLIKSVVFIKKGRL